MRDFLREHWWAVVLSVMFHGLLVGSLVFAALMSAHRTPPSVQPLPIDAVVVSSQVLHASQAARERAEQEAATAKAAQEAKAAQDAEAAQDAKAVQDAKAAADAKAAEQAKAAQDAKVTAEAKAAAE